MMSPQSRILVAGARGMVGSAIVRRLLAGGYMNVLSPRREQLDLLDQAAVRIESADTLESLAEKIHAVEHALLPAVIARLSERNPASIP